MTDGQTYLTPEGLEKLKEELRQLKFFRRKEIADKIERAKELGDLSENAEYQEAKDEQAFTEGRIIELETLLNTATIISAPSGTKQVEIGNTVTVRQNGDERVFAIVGANEADPANGKISNESPLGRSLIGKRAGEEFEVVVPKGKMTYRVKEIS
ncbi:MAG: transcription elongation factor GreA [bacterium]|nr:transcription elongation factor GreA [bacterium]